MSEAYIIKPVAHIHTDFPQRFGIPRQSGLIPELQARIVFDREFRDENAIKGMEGFSYLWLIWGFSQTRIDMEAQQVQWSPTVAPPRLGGKVRAGVFATRSPYRPNSLGLSSVRLLEIDRESPEGPVLVVGGADLMDGTPIYDIKPYVPYADAHPDASGGFAVSQRAFLKVDFPQDLWKKVPSEKRQALLAVLSQDPRGSYEKQPDYVYGLRFAGFDIRFTVEEEELHVFDVILVHEESAGYKNVK